MSDFVKTPFTYTDDDGNSLVLDREPEALTFRTLRLGDTQPGPQVRVPLHAVTFLFSHLITVATATPVPDFTALEHPRV